MSEVERRDVTRHFNHERFGPLYGCNRRLWNQERQTNNSHAYVRKITIRSHGRRDRLAT